MHNGWFNAGDCNMFGQLLDELAVLFLGCHSTVLGKDTLRWFPLLGGSDKQSKFQSYLYIKLKNQIKNYKSDSNISASPEAGRGNRLPYVQRLRRFPASQEDKYRDKNNMEQNRADAIANALYSDPTKKHSGNQSIDLAQRITFQLQLEEPKAPNPLLRCGKIITALC